MSLRAALFLLACAVAPVVNAAATNWFDKVFIIVMENKDYTTAMADPYLGTTLKAKGRLLSNYWALTHPSQPNYIGMIAGQFYGIQDDSNHNLSGPIVVDLLDNAGISWKSYQENYPGNCYTSSSYNSLYYRKHNPFISFSSVYGNSARCAKIVPATQLDTDIANNAVPKYSFYTPNIKNDAHDTTITYGSNWLKGFLEPKLTSAAFAKTMFLITFDEGSGSGNVSTKVYTMLVGDAIVSRGLANTIDSTKYTHYSQISTVEANWGLPKLSPAQGDSTAPAFNL
ncbi:hypothetical protein HDV00_000812 [Rhizophlyctis rosea]|nr:hypothetical protein HDV00_000812 [Rhizophlyctis rosea]